MTEINNVEFVKEFAKRASVHNKLAERISTIHKRAIELRDKESRTIHLINEKVMGTGTSSLRKTTLELGKRGKIQVQDISVPSGYTEKETAHYITFNHMGIGTIKDIVGGKLNGEYVWGGNVSQKLNDEDFKAVMFDINMRNNIKNQLITMNANKLLRTFLSIENTIPDLKTIVDIPGLCEGEMKKQLVNKVRIFFGEMSGSDFETREFLVDSIKISDRVRIQLIGKSLDRQEREFSEEPATLYLSTTTIEGAIAMIQMTNELNEIFDVIDAELAATEAKVSVAEESIKNKLAIYLVMQELGDDK